MYSNLISSPTHPLPDQFDVLCSDLLVIKVMALSFFLCTAEKADEETHGSQDMDVSTDASRRNSKGGSRLVEAPLDSPSTNSPPVDAVALLDQS